MHIIMGSLADCHIIISVSFRSLRMPAAMTHQLHSTTSFTLHGLRLQAGQKGVLVRRIEPTLPANQQLRKGDILLSFDGTQIGNDGTVAFRSGERIGFSYLISNKQNDEDVSAHYKLFPSFNDVIEIML